MLKKFQNMRIVFRKCFFFKPKKNRRALTLLSLLKSMLLLILGYLFCLFVLVRLLCGVFFIQFSATTVVDSDSFILSDYGVGSSKTSHGAFNSSFGPQYSLTVTARKNRLIGNSKASCGLCSGFNQKKWTLSQIYHAS